MERLLSPTIPKISLTHFTQRRIILGLVHYPEIAFPVIIIALAGKGAAPNSRALLSNS
jgi:hypothetical protein